MPDFLIYFVQIIVGLALVYLASQISFDNRLILWGDWIKGCVMSLIYLAGMGLVGWGFSFGILKPVFYWIWG